MRYVVAARWVVSSPGEFPVRLEGTRKEAPTAKQALALVKLLLDEVGVWQISLTDTGHQPDLEDHEQRTLEKEP